MISSVLSWGNLSQNWMWKLFLTDKYSTTYSCKTKVQLPLIYVKCTISANIGQLHLNSKPPLWNNWEVSFTGGVWISNRIAHLALPHEILTPSAINLIKILQRVYGLQVGLLNRLIHLKFTLPQVLQYNFPKYFTWGVRILNGINFIVGPLIHWLFFLDALWDSKGTNCCRVCPLFNPIMHQKRIINGSAIKLMVHFN